MDTFILPRSQGSVGKKETKIYEQASIILQIITENYGDPQFNVALLADKSGKSLSYLRDIVYSTYGMSIHKLIETCRLEQAIKLLADNNECLELVSQKSGFFYAKTFRTAFKKRLGMTPHECRQILANTKDKNFEITQFLKLLWSSENKINR